MDELAAGLRREQAVRLLLPLFFLSGATALVYQTLWARQLHLVFGTSTFAIATVLAAFMAGLALGGAWMARHADRIRQPLMIYGVLEVVIGVYALVFPYVVDWVLTPTYLQMWRVVEPSPLVFGIAQFAMVGVALLLPTSMMGATLPLLARFATQRLGAVGDRVGLLYGINTAGAVFGTWLAGFVLLPGMGLWKTTIAAAAANLVLGGGAILLDGWARAGASRIDLVDDLDRSGAAYHPALLPVAVTMGLAGFASLVYEVAWTRVLVLMLGASVYAFSVMLLAFLIGIALGGFIGGKFADRIFARGGQGGVLVTLAVIEIGVAATSFGLMFAFQELPFWYVWLYDALDVAHQAGLVWAMSLVIAGLVMTPPAILMGAAFPIAVRAVVHDTGALGGPVGKIYAANTLGSVLGAALAGFTFLPLIGVRHTIIVAGFVNMLAAAVVVLWTRKARVPRWGLGMVAASPVVLGFVASLTPWDPLVMTAAMYKYVSSFSDHSREGIRAYAVDAYDLLFYEEGLSSVVTVARNKDSGGLWLANNGKVDASTNVDMPTQVLVGLLPFQFVEDPKEVLVIGLASGITAGVVTTVDDIERLDIVELEPATIRAARFFDEYNHQVLDDPRTQLITNDGRNHVLLAEESSYDVIISEPPNPWISGVANLFTKDFLEIGKTRLKPGGVWTQWVQLYGMDREDLRSLLATFSDVYPHVILYTTIVDADLVLVGSEAPIEQRIEVVDAMTTRWPRVGEEFEAIGLEASIDVMATYLMDRDRLREMAGVVDRNTDDNMRVEYSAPMNLHRETSDHNVALLLRHAMMPPSMDDDPVALARLASAYLSREDDERSRQAIAAAMSLQAERFGGATLSMRDSLAEQLQKDDAAGATRLMTAMAYVMAQSAEPPLEFLDAWDDWRRLTVEQLEEDLSELGREEEELEATGG